MKKISFVAIACFATIIGSAQTVATSFSKKDKVEVTNWDARSVSFISGYWEMARPQLIKKFSSELVDSIVAYSSSTSYPAGLDDFLGLDEAFALPVKNKLKVYLVGTFDNNFGGKFHGTEYVLILPKDENKNWKPGIEWEHDIFIIIPKNAVSTKQ
jgi:hypothetical protein